MPTLSSSFRRIAVAGVAVLVLGGAAVGIAAAQAQPSTTPTGTGFPGGGRGPRGFGGGLELNTAATIIGVTPQELRTELQTKSLTDVATAHGKQPADVAKALKDAAHARIDQRIDQLMTQVLPRGGRSGEFGFGGRGLIRQGLDVAAQAIGIDTQQLRQELPGHSLADVAQAHGKTAADVATALKNAAHQKIDQMATARGLTADQVNTMKTNADQRIDHFVNQTLPQRGPGGPGAEQDESGA